VPRQLFLLGFCMLVGNASCRPKNNGEMLVSRESFAELRVVKGRVTITDTAKRPRVPYPRERLAEGAQLKLDDDSVVSMRDDLGATWLLAGPAQLRVTKRAVELTSGKAFVDTQGGPAVTITTPSGTLEVSDGRSSISTGTAGTADAYVLRGSLRHGAIRANAGEMLTLGNGRNPETSKVAAWNDWTSGLGTADPEAQPAPFGVGTVGARSAGDQGKPRFSLVIERLEVRVTVNHDFALTEVDETFVNPSSNEVEGIFSFRVPRSGVLHRFGVDRDGLLVWGKTQEKRTAAAQYQANVYAGSTEDPALLEWLAPGVYQARLYPIAAGASRRVVTRYGEWLARSGTRGERRLYVYPMAATGAEGTLPRIEEMTLRLDWSKASASSIRAPLGAVVRGKQLVVKAFDVLPKSDFAVELFDAGQSELLAYRSKHALAEQDAPFGAEADFASKTSNAEPDYVLLPLSLQSAEAPEPGLDLAIVVDSSAATESSAMAVSRSLVEAVLNALGPTDRAALFTGDSTLRPVAAESQHLVTLDAARKRTWLAELANAPLGGATDIGTLLAEAAERLEPKRRGAVIYIGDGRPSVGELLPKALHERMNRLPPTARIFAAGVGSQVNHILLASLVRGAPLELVQNGYEAAQAALRLLEAANASSSWQNCTVTLSGVDRLLPRNIPVVAAGEPALLVGRIADDHTGNQLEVVSPAGKHAIPVRVVTIDDDGDLRRRWGNGRLNELSEQQAGRLAMVDLARRYGLVTPYTSLYVATRSEAEAETSRMLAGSVFSPEGQRDSRDGRRTRWRPWGAFWMLPMRPLKEANVAVAEQEIVANNKEGGTGTRAKGEEGSMGNPAPNKPQVARSASLVEAKEFGMIGSLGRAVPTGATVRVGGGSAEPREAETPGAPSGLEPAATGELRRHGEVAASAPVTPRAAKTSLVATASTMTTKSKLTSGAKPSALADPLGGDAEMKQAGGSPTGSGDASEVSVGGTPAGAGVESGRGAIRTGQSSPGGASSPSNAGRTSAPSSGGPRSSELSPIAQLSHQLAPCSAASDLPLDERRKLWLERLSSCSTVAQVRDVFDNAVRGCEAPGWYERQFLLYAMVNHLGSVRERVGLYQSFARSPAIAESIYRAILVRIVDAASLRELHEALGVKTAAPELVIGLLRRAADATERARLLHGMVVQWPNDFELILRLLEAYEDSDDIAAARTFARRLRRRADSTSHVRTLLGEFYWRCSERENGPDKSRDLEEARRAFGEIVEFAPDDPAARRRLGDLLRAHGRYEEALRQYETLRDMLPDDPSVHLLIASAAQGIGKTEEALRWSEKAAATAAPDGQGDFERAAQAIGSAILAWAREDAEKAGQKGDAERLLLRGRKFALDPARGEERIRFILTWEHPELRPSMYGLTNSGPVLGHQMSMLGVAEQLAIKEEPRVELRLDPEDAERVARLGAEAVLTAIIAEGTPGQRATRIRTRFGDLRHPKPTLRFAYVDGALREESL
jgi:tetratricopeptide (TPR) repeat protein